MSRSFVHVRIGGLDRFALKENLIDAPDLSDVTSVTVTVGSTTVYSTAYNDGPVRWNTSETKPGEVIALVPTAGFTDNNEAATITIVNPANPAGQAWGPKTIPVGTASLFGLGGENREQCDVCGGWFPVSQLVRQLQIRRRNPRQNFLYSSRYDSDYWTLTGANALGEVSMGRSRFRWDVHPYKNANAADGAHSFWGDGELVAQNTVDLSSFTNAVLRGRFGTHQMTKKPGLTIDAGVYYDYGGAGETKYSFGIKTGMDGTTVLFLDDLSAIAGAHLSALSPYFAVTTYDDQQIWWVEDMRLQKDVTGPDLTTAVSRGAPVDDSFEMKTFGAMVVCEKHRDHLPKQVDEYVPEADAIEVVDTEDQEF